MKRNHQPENDKDREEFKKSSHVYLPKPLFGLFSKPIAVYAEMDCSQRFDTIMCSVLANGSAQASGGGAKYCQTDPLVGRCEQNIAASYVAVGADGVFNIAKCENIVRRKTDRSNGQSSYLGRLAIC
ncbi:hypothetical protein GHV40_08870 [Devosia sp. D6-9]|nr:hypothetical protein GHV40_08870 [Devosia sp. D6-9]